MDLDAEFFARSAWKMSIGALSTAEGVASYREKLRGVVDRSIGATS
jgi:hypothetical protein